MPRDLDAEIGEVTHDEAEQIAMAYIDHAFGNPEKPGRRVRHCIPANPRTDTDIRLMAYIRQQRAKEAPAERAPEEAEVSVENCGQPCPLLGPRCADCVSRETPAQPNTSIGVFSPESSLEAFRDR